MTQSKDVEQMTGEELREVIANAVSFAPNADAVCALRALALFVAEASREPYEVPEHAISKGELAIQLKGMEKSKVNCFMLGRNTAITIYRLALKRSLQ